jgi:shikimate dehydrogenase
MQKYAVIGYPLTHSLSPQIHNFAFEELNINAVYEKIEIHPDELESKIQQLKSSGYDGFNVTIPHKQTIMNLIDQTDDDAKEVGAVNTLVKKGFNWTGFNTDVIGFLTPLMVYKERVKNCLVLGTGGAARAVIYALLKYIDPELITVSGRNIGKAQDLSNEFSILFDKVNINHQDLKSGESILSSFDLLINTTPLGMYPEVTQSPLPNLTNLRENSIVYDLVYNPLRTKLLNDAGKAGKNIICINGMEMLIQQAAHAFKLWTNRDMPINDVRNYLSTILKTT